MRNTILPAFLELSTPKVHSHPRTFPHAGDYDVVARPLVLRVREADLVACPVLSGDRVSAAAEPKRRAVMKRVQDVVLGESQRFHLPDCLRRKPDAEHIRRW